MDKDELKRLNQNFQVVDETLLYGITPRLGSHLAEFIWRKVSTHQTLEYLFTYICYISILGRT